MYKQAIEVLQDFRGHVLVSGTYGAGKSTLLKTFKGISRSPDLKYYNFEQTQAPLHEDCYDLCEENAPYFLDDIIDSKESIIILDCVILSWSTITQFFGIAKIYKKRLIVVSRYPDQEVIQLFDAHISLSYRWDGCNQKRECKVEILQDRCH